MTLRSTSIHDGDAIAPAFAMGAPGNETPGNRSPHLAWSGVPDGTRSFVVTCVDPDAPTSKETDTHAEIPATRTRTDFVHWVLYDLGAAVREIAEGADSDGITARGKAADGATVGTRGQNDYTDYFEGDAAMAGTYTGYDGPYPPDNDARVHRYRFTVHAIDIDTLGLAPGATHADVVAAMKGHELASATITGTYTLNPALR